MSEPTRIDEIIRDVTAEYLAAQMLAVERSSPDARDELRAAFAAALSVYREDVLAALEPLAPSPARPGCNCTFCELRRVVDKLREDAISRGA